MVVSQTCSKIVKDVLQQNCVLLEPFVSVELIGEEEMIEHAIKDIIRKRGRIEMR
jgi:translation elongation factor EF-G